VKCQRLSLMIEMKTQTNIHGLPHFKNVNTSGYSLSYLPIQETSKQPTLLQYTLFSKLTDNKTKYQRQIYVTTTELQCLTFSAVHIN